MRHCTWILAIIAAAACQPPQTGLTAGATTALDTGTTDDTTAAPGPPTTGSVDSTGTTTSGAGMTASGAEATTGEPDPTSTGTSDPVDPTEDDEPVGPWKPKGCPEIYAQDLLPTFEIVIDPDELEALEDEWHEADDNNTPEHPVTFIYEDTVIHDASVRLRGNSTWWPTQGKMQLEVSFNTYNKKGRFMGLKHILFDAERYN
ncbi:MAG TPA: hypothetical protein VIK91_05180, partial [Nannocystis sp.]